MADFQALVSGLKRAEAQLEHQLASVRSAIVSLTTGGGSVEGATPAGKRGPGRPKGSGKKTGRRTMSAAARKRISEAQKARWAKQKAGKK
jgi:hypothetical protein